MPVTPPALLAVLLAFASTFLLGGLWYSPLLFGGRWQEWVGLTDEQLRSTTGRTFGVAAVSALVFSVNLGFFIGGASNVGFGAFAGLASGVFMACAVTTSYVFARRPARLIAVDAGYHLAAATVAGSIIGALGAA
jgi:hypothetical protein